MAHQCDNERQLTHLQPAVGASQDAAFLAEQGALRIDFKADLDAMAPTWNAEVVRMGTAACQQRLSRIHDKLQETNNTWTQHAAMPSWSQKTLNIATIVDTRTILQVWKIIRLSIPD